MRACLLHTPGPVDARPLVLREVARPDPGDDELLVRVEFCGVCRTDLHVVEGDLPVHKSPVVPGHQVVGRIESAGRLATRFTSGERVGIPWLHRTCGRCDYCRAGKENLCMYAKFTGYD